MTGRRKHCSEKPAGSLGQPACEAQGHAESEGSLKGQGAGPQSVDAEKQGEHLSFSFSHLFTNSLILQVPIGHLVS